MENVFGSGAESVTSTVVEPVPRATTSKLSTVIEADATDGSGGAEIEYGGIPPENSTLAVSPVERLSEDRLALNPEGSVPRSLQPYSRRIPKRN
jgi:hypothetical protein